MGLDFKVIVNVLKMLKRLCNMFKRVKLELKVLSTILRRKTVDYRKIKRLSYMNKLSIRIYSLNKLYREVILKHHNFLIINAI